MSELTLIAEVFPRGVVFRLRHEGGKFVIRWQYLHKPYSIEAPTILLALEEALKAVSVLQGQGGVL